MIRSRSFLWMVLAATLLVGGPGPVASKSSVDPLGSPAEAQKSIEPTSEESRFVELANRERASRRLRPLSIDPLLIEVGRQHSREMMEKGYFDHNSPTVGLKTPMDRYLKVLGFRPEYACVGENLFYCNVVDVERGHQAFMNSPAHRENVLYSRFDKTGVGIQKNAKGEFWVTAMYLTNAGR